MTALGLSKASLPLRRATFRSGRQQIHLRSTWRGTVDSFLQLNIIGIVSTKLLPQSLQLLSTTPLYFNCGIVPQTYFKCTPLIAVSTPQEYLHPTFIKETPEGHLASGNGHLVSSIEPLA